MRDSGKRGSGRKEKQQKKWERGKKREGGPNLLYRLICPA